MYYSFILYEISKIRSAWVAQLVEHQTLAQVMISWFVGLSPISGFVLTAWTMLWILSLSL